jgi:hypothetical protein
MIGIRADHEVPALEKELRPLFTQFVTCQGSVSGP